jgi:hypothetical protein
VITDSINNINRIKGAVLDALQQDSRLNDTSVAEIGAALATTLTIIMERIIEGSPPELVERNRKACATTLERMKGIVLMTRAEIPDGSGGKIVTH